MMAAWPWSSLMNDEAEQYASEQQDDHPDDFTDSYSDLSHGY